jgi:hypothetical protein
LLLSEDYEGAAALKKVNKDRSTFIMLQSQDAITVPADSTCQETLVKNYEVDLSILLSRRDFEGAAALKRAKGSGCLSTALIRASTL